MKKKFLIIAIAAALFTIPAHAGGNPKDALRVAGKAKNGITWGEFWNAVNGALLQWRW